MQSKVGILRDFVAPLRAQGGFRGALRKFGPVYLLDAGLRDLWLRLGMRVLRVCRPHVTQRYGWLEALLFPAYDYWLRYAGVIASLQAVSRCRPCRLLEVSSGRHGIAAFLDSHDMQVCLVDQTVEILTARRRLTCWRVCADACTLPFPTASFDVVISVDTVEHIPRSQRAGFLTELKRVASRGVIVSCPLESEDGRFQARRFDLLLQQELKASQAKVPAWLDDHIEKRHPTDGELLDAFPGAQIESSQNCESWVRFESFYLRPFVWVLAGFFYLLALKKHDVEGPHWRGLLVWQKRLEGETANPTGELWRMSDPDRRAQGPTN